MFFPEMFILVEVLATMYIFWWVSEKIEYSKYIKEQEKKVLTGKILDRIKTDRLIRKMDRDA